MKILVSLTTTCDRSHLLGQSLPSLVHQDLTPDALIVNISRAPYLKDRGFSQIPQWLERMPVTINWVENTGSYRKLLPVLSDADTDDLVVTADDDIVYGRSWLSSLVQAHHSSPGAIVCCRGRKMKKNIFGRWQNYRNWPLANKEMSGLHILPTGGAGTVYTRRLVHLDFIFDSTFLKIGPKNDDLWFKMASMRVNVPAKVCPEIDRSNTYLEHKLGLDKDNFSKVRSSIRLFKFVKRTVIQGKNYLGINHTENDAAWDAICTYSESFSQDNKWPPKC